MKKENVNPTVEAVILLHSISETEFEVIDIGFDDTEYNNLTKVFCSVEKSTNEDDREKVQTVLRHLSHIDAVREIAVNELCDYGEVTKEIHNELWQQNNIERYYCIEVKLWLTDHEDYFGEVDTDVEYEYNVCDLKNHWDKLDLMQKGSKLYYIDYEKNKVLYTVSNIEEVHDNEFQKTGMYYIVYSEEASIRRYHRILADTIDKNRFFTSSKLAHEAYKAKLN